MFVVHSPAWCPADTCSAIDNTTHNITFLKSETLKNQRGLQEPMAELAQGWKNPHAEKGNSLQKTSWEQAAVAKSLNV